PAGRRARLRAASPDTSRARANRMRAPSRATARRARSGERRGGTVRALRRSARARGESSREKRKGCHSRRSAPRHERWHDTSAIAFRYLLRRCPELCMETTSHDDAPNPAPDRAAPFDAYAGAYVDLVATSISASGENPEYFGQYKVECLRRLEAP